MLALPPLPYPGDALEPVLSAASVRIHYMFHEAAHLQRLNALITSSSSLQRRRTLTIEEIVSRFPLDSEIYALAAEIWNHTVYWHSMRPICAHDWGTQVACGLDMKQSPANLPTGAIATLIRRDFGHISTFFSVWMSRATVVLSEGSGWLWLVLTETGHLAILRTGHSEVPERLGAGRSLMVCDLWEHAFMIDYNWDIQEYIASWFRVVNWDFVNANLKRNILAAGLTTMSMTVCRL